jgi:hypothetical protein
MSFMSKLCERAVAAALGALAIAFASPAWSAASEQWDPTLPHRFSLERARVPSRVSPVRLPENPEVAWRVRVAGGVAFAPAVTPEGSVIVSLTTPVVAEYDKRGRLSWTARLGASTAATTPLVLGDGSRLVLTQAGEALAFSPRGEPLRRIALPFASLDVEPQLAATFDGGLLIAAGRRVVRLDASLGVVSSVRANRDIKALLTDPDHSLVVTSNGEVFELGLNGALRRLAVFAGVVDAVVRNAPEHLLAIVDKRRLVELDLSTLSQTTRFAEPDVELLPMLAQNAKGEVRVLTNLDFLLALGADARESFRVALPSAVARRAATEFAFDAQGTTLIARSGVDLVSVRADGSLVRLEGTACADPLAPLGAAPGYAVLACRSGIVLGLRDRQNGTSH